MRSLKLAAVCLASTLAVATPAFGAAGVIETSVTLLSDPTTYRKSDSTPPLITYVGYTVTVTNSGVNTVNSVRFTGTTAVTDLQETATFSSAEGASCAVAANPPAAPANASSISCAIGQLRAGGTASFTLFFLAPAQDPITPLPAGSDFVKFSGITYYAEGTNDSTPPSPNNSANPWTAADATLGTSNPTRIKTAVPKGGGSFFTGAGAISTGADKFTTWVQIPPAASFTQAEVNESPLASAADLARCTNFDTCYRSDVTIPGKALCPFAPFANSCFSPYLTIVLRQDASNIKRPNGIASVLIVYVDESGEHLVGDCASPTTPRTDGLPCIAKRVYYKNSRVPGWTPDLDGDFEWTLINTKNGGYDAF